MAIIPQKNLFSWRQVEASSDLNRLKLVLEGIGDERLMWILEEKRKGRRDDYPIRAYNVYDLLVQTQFFRHYDWVMEYTPLFVE